MKFLLEILEIMLQGFISILVLLGILLFAISLLFVPMALSYYLNSHWYLLLYVPFFSLMVGINAREGI